MNLLLSKSSIAPRRIDFMGELTKEVDRAMNEVFGAPFFNNVTKRSRGYPLMDAVRTTNNLILQYTVPGVKLNDLKVQVEDDDHGQILTVSGKLSSDYSYSDNAYQIKELSSQEFRRVIRLPEDISDKEPIASLKDGILTLSFEILPTVKEQTPKVKMLKITQQ